MSKKIKQTKLVMSLTAAFLLAYGQQSFASQAACDQLLGMTIPAASIGLPSNGAHVVSTIFGTVATPQLPDTTPPYYVGDFCQLIGEIAPIDPTAPPIRFQLSMPDAWNQKAMMFGGGGYNGVLRTFPSGLGNLLITGTTSPTPLARGYATFGSDSGHTLRPPFIFGRDGSFAVNDEALANYAGNALKKTRDSAMYLITAYYGHAPQKTYFQGTSTGGREAMTVVQRWPQDFDGAVALAPAWNMQSMLLQMGRISQALAQPGAYLNNAKRQLIRDVAVANCDHYDGALDGIIGDVKSCEENFDPATATLDGVSTSAKLRCADGTDLGDSCLSDAQLAMLKVYGSRFKFGYTLASGEKQYPAFHMWGTDLGVATTNPDLALISVTNLNLMAPANPITPSMPFMSVYYDQWAKYFLTRDASFNSLLLDPKNPGPWLPRLNQLSLMLDSSQKDLTPFQQKGGKLILIHGMNDATVTAAATEQYFKGMKKAMGKHNRDSFVRYYQIPGYGHALSPSFNAMFDALTVLEQWAEHGVAPGNLQAVDKTGVPGRTRPVCVYPKWPQYIGSGDINLASSFQCVGSDDDDHEEHDGDD